MHLERDELIRVREILAMNVPGLAVWVFGSRASGRTPKRSSDLDLALMTDTPLGARAMADLREAFDQSDLPFKVDLVDWASLDEAFRERIRAVHEEL